MSARRLAREAGKHGLILRRSSWQRRKRWVLSRADWADRKVYLVYHNLAEVAAALDYGHKKTAPR